MDCIVFKGLVIAWRLAGSPTLRSPFFKKATTEGVVRRPSSFAITTGSLPSITDTHELVVPKSIPIIFAIVNYKFILFCYPSCNGDFYSFSFYNQLICHFVFAEIMAVMLTDLKQICL